MDIVERLRDTKHHPWEICQDAADEIARLRDENAKLREDAERYRWLRTEASAADWEMFGYQDIDMTDAAIDAAMQKGE